MRSWLSIPLCWVFPRLKQWAWQPVKLFFRAISEQPPLWGYSDMLTLNDIYSVFEIEIGPFQSTYIKFRLSAFQNCKEFPQKVIFSSGNDFLKNLRKLQKKVNQFKTFLDYYFYTKKSKICPFYILGFQLRHIPFNNYKERIKKVIF